MRCRTYETIRLDDDAAEARLDAADTRAYLRAEEVLAPAQRERAREIAADYRAALYEQREAERGGAGRH